MKFKKFLPRSLFGRFLLIITIPNLIMQIIASLIFFYFYVDVISKHMARSVAYEMAFIRNSVENPKFDTENDEILQEFSKTIDLNYYFEEKKGRRKLKIADSKWRRHKIYQYVNLFPLIDPLNRFKSELKSARITPFEIFEDKNDDDIFIVKTPTSNGILSFEVKTKRIDSSSKYVFIAWMFFVAIITSLISIIFLKNQLRPISALNRAAEKFGRGVDEPDFRPSGSKEVRSVAISFMKMKERISRQISQRTDMLSSVSHDLRTPLTRMKLSLAMMDEKDAAIQDLKQDVDDMAHLVEEYLDFARNQEREKNIDINLFEFLNKEIISYYTQKNQNLKYKIEIAENYQISIKKLAFKRALRNLIDNALKYGQNCYFLAYLSRNNLIIAIEDDGPGIPDQEKQNVLEPFYRIDNSRNLDSEIDGKKVQTGSGLGLSIALDAITSQGGRIRLLNSKFGGLKVIIFIPI